MNMTLIRTRGTKDFTHGKLRVNNSFFCDTIEDEERPSKIWGKTAIPVGRYEIILNMSNRFKVIMPLLLEVPNFAGIRIHSGNTALDTEGCILLGTFKRPGTIINSRIAYRALMKVLRAAIADKQKIWIEIK